MAYTVTISPSGHQFTCKEEETILHAGLSSHIGLPYGCKNGACGACKGRVLSGQFTLGKHQSQALSQEEEAQGYTLFCSTHPQSDLTIAIREIEEKEFPSKKLPARILKLEKLSDDVMLVLLQLPPAEKFAYRAGQYIDFLLRDNQRRSYSMANAAQNENQVSLHIRHMPGGVFTDQLFSTLKERDIVRIEGPQGTFFLRANNDKPIILLASGTGFAPIKAIIEEVIRENITQPVYLYWGVRHPEDLYMNALCQSWVKQIKAFHYIPVVSEPTTRDAWKGRIGLVHQAVLQDFPTLAHYQVYACGAPVMVNAAKHDFIHRAQLPSEFFYADAFISQADLT